MTEPSPERPASGAAVTAAAPAVDLWRRFRGDGVAVGGLLVFLVVAAAALAAPWIAPQDPYDLTAIDLFDGRLAPGEESLSGTVYLLGTDDQGRDMVSAILYGLRISLMVGVVGTLFAVAIGVLAGLTAAYLGRWWETGLMRLVDFQLSFPAIMVALILLAILGRGVDKVILAIILVHWAQYARVIRGAALVERNKEYIEAAQNLGFSRLRIMLVHLLPNCLAPILVVGTIRIASAISTEATLSFLGVGVPITEPSLGLLIANGYDYLMSGQYWISVFPGVALLILIVAINLIGDRLRDILNPRLRT